MQPPEIVSTQAQKTAIISIPCARDEIRSVMGPGITELVATLNTQGIVPTGPWFTHHLQVPTDRFDFEISFPVSDTVKHTGRVVSAVLPAATVARTVYRGPYEGLSQAWTEFKDWILANGYQAAPDLWEVYLLGPESSADPQEWQTQFNQPLIGY